METLCVMFQLWLKKCKTWKIFKEAIESNGDQTWQAILREYGRHPGVRRGCGVNKWRKISCARRSACFSRQLWLLPPAGGAGRSARGAAFANLFIGNAFSNLFKGILGFLKPTKD
ncbi:hypothetical protein L195_g040713 [Trifolium pratense]|uniref:Uncharacterized protein n=1 Tax=Trifolium pratense TaxID=57577 RepID=A0A2K3M1K6_TRIPR|nr:hypothetical protein L195_g040713 [Trifolium pratense]